MSFTNKVVIVTGASSGIGAATAVLFAKEGADVAIVARTQSKLEAVAKQIQEYGKKPLVIRADLSKEDDAAVVVPRTIEHFGKLDVLINNAGITVEGSIMNGKVLEAYDEIMKTNVRAVLQLTMLAAPHLINTKGNVVNVSSAAALTTCRNPAMISYYLSKAALDHLTRCAALELAASGVRVNGVNPGPVDNAFLDHNGFGNVDKYKQGLIDSTALGYMATDEEIAGLILFLASDKAKSVTGSNYLIDNGILLKI